MTKNEKKTQHQAAARQDHAEADDPYSDAPGHSGKVAKTAEKQSAAKQKVAKTAENVSIDHIL